MAPGRGANQCSQYRQIEKPCVVRRLLSHHGSDDGLEMSELGPAGGVLSLHLIDKSDQTLNPRPGIVVGHRPSQGHRYHIAAVRNSLPQPEAGILGARPGFENCPPHRVRLLGEEKHDGQAVGLYFR